MRGNTRWITYAGWGLLALVLLLVFVLYAASGIRLGRNYEIEPSTVALPVSLEAFQRGEHLATAVARCVDCHGEGMSGAVFIDSAAIGRFAGPNLTTGRGGIGAQLTDEDWIRAIRHGIGRDGEPLLFMPSDAYFYLSDADLAALIAYMKSLPAIHNEVPKSKIGPIGRVLLLSGKFPVLAAERIDHSASPPPAPEPGVTVDYGRYLARIGGCAHCHGPTFSGGPIPGAPPEAPPGTNLTPDPNSGLGRWREADFIRAIRTGRRPGGTEIDPFMPWKTMRQMTDEELRALWAFLWSLPPLPYGAR